jgi:hypothetical protein
MDTVTLDEGLKALAAWRPELVDSGFALDLLEHHTTSMDTAEARTRAELHVRYPHRDDVLDECLRILEESSLLIPAETRWEADAVATPTDRPRPDVAATRLGHDTLAPLVREMFRTSDAPGQRARRLLEDRASEWQDGKTGHVLESSDLRAVADGKSGMRAWTMDENRLVEASRRAEVERRVQEQEWERRLHEDEEQAEEETMRRLKEQEESNLRLRRRAVALGATLAVTIGVALLAADRWRAAVRATGIANQKTEDARRAAGIANEDAKRTAEIAKSQTQLAQQRLKTATSMHLAARSTAERNRRLDLSLLLAVEALRTSNTFEARDSLYKALQERPGLRYFVPVFEGTSCMLPSAPTAGLSPQKPTTAWCCGTWRRAAAWPTCRSR